MLEYIVRETVRVTWWMGACSSNAHSSDTTVKIPMNVSCLEMATAHGSGVRSYCSSAEC